METPIHDDHTPAVRHAAGEAVRDCAICQRRVRLADGTYVGSGRWCCMACAAALLAEEGGDGFEE
jgi:hypothetical protein